jgi:adenine-specific DNA-methyltransferase
VIKYIGSKRTLVPRIVALANAVRAATGARTVVDLFTGTTRVAQALKGGGFAVTANDLASYSEVLATAYIACDAATADIVRLSALVEQLNALPGVEGYVTRTFCEEARYFQPVNGRRIDAVRAAIDTLARDPMEHAILLTSLLEAADRVDSTTGIQMAYLKGWAPRSHKALTLRVPELIAGTGTVARTDANDFVRTMSEVDIAYIDPPYNQHSYFSNYHVWETIVRNDAPPAYGIARKREDCRTVKSAFNAKPRAWAAFSELMRDVRATHLLVSFSNEGFFAKDDLLQLLQEVRGEVAAVPVAFKRYVGAQIGIHNLHGKKVGQVGHLMNREYLFLAGPGAIDIVASVAENVAFAV